MPNPTSKPSRGVTRPNPAPADSDNPRKPILGRRRRNADDAEPIVSFAVLRKLRGREHRELRQELEGDRFLRRAVAARVIQRMEEEGIEPDSDTPILDWIRDNWEWILQAIRDLTGFFGGGV